MRILSATFGILFALVACSDRSVEAASYHTVTSRAAFDALVPKLVSGDTVDLGATPMGRLFLKDGMGDLSGVTIKGGRFDTMELRGLSNVTFEGGRVIMPVNDEMRRQTPAVFLSKVGNLTIRNYEITTDRTEGKRPGYGIRLDSRSGGSGVVLEDVLIHDIASGVVAFEPHNLTLRRVTARNLSADAFFISKGDGVLLDQLRCDPFSGTDQSVVHADCVQIDKVAGPTANLTIRDLRVVQDNNDFAQWIFAPAALQGGRHRNWKITGLRGSGNTWRALSVDGVDGLVIEDNIMLQPEKPVQAAKGGAYRPMMFVNNSTDIVLRNNAACRHFRLNNINVDEKGQKTLPCRR